MERQSSLKRKSLTALVAYVILFTAITGSLTYWIVEAPIRDQLTTNLDLRAELLAAEVKAPLDSSLGILDSVVTIGQSIQRTSDQKHILSSLFSQVEGVVVSGGLWPKPREIGGKIVYSSLFYNKASDGRVDLITSWNNPAAGGYDNEAWYKHAAILPKQRVTWSPVYVDPYTRIQMITVSQPYFVGGEFAGVATVDLSLTSLIDFIVQSAEKYQLGVKLTDSYKSTIASHAFRVREGGYMSQKRFGQFDWTIEVVNSRKTVKEEMYSIVRDIESWNIPVLLIGIIVGYWMLNQYVISPIVDIANRLKSSKEGGIIDVPYRSHDEIRFLVESLNQKTIYLEAERRKAQASTTAKSNFLATLSHEIRTPMNGVLGNAQLLMDDSPTKSQMKRLRVLTQSGEHMMSLLDEILDYSKIEQGFLDIDNADFALEPLLESISSVYTGLCDEKGLALNVISEVDVTRCYLGDISRIKQVLFNLLNNAVKFTQFGQIDVKFNESSLDENTAILSISVSDTGVGIPEAALEKIFKPFEQAEESTTRRFGGTGLGLAIVEQLISLMGGTIDVGSEVGKGSTFSLTLPLEIRENVEQETTLINQDVLFTGLRALIVEDNRINASILQSFLTKRDFECHWVENGQEALNILHEERFDVIFMDHHMPVMDGIEAIESIRQLPSSQRNVFILGCTADVFKQAKDKMRNVGADFVINKPVVEKELNDLLYRNSDSLYQFKSSHHGPEISDTIENLLVSFNMSIENRDLNASSHLLRTIQANLSLSLDQEASILIEQVIGTIDAGNQPEPEKVDDLTIALTKYC